MPRVNLYEEEFNNLINDRGNTAIWEQAAVCSCVSRDSGQPRFNCPVCGGSGYRYLDPKSITVAVSSLAGSVQLDTLQLREPGTAYITPMTDVIMGFRDRVKFPDFQCKFSEVIQWDSSTGEPGVSQRTYRDIRSVVSLCDYEYEYEEGLDFEVTEDGYHLRWLNSDFRDSKLDGRNMSLLYMTTPSYLVKDLLHELRGTRSDRNSASVTYRELPKQYLIQREDFIYNVAEPRADLGQSSGQDGSTSTDDSESGSKTALGTSSEGTLI